MATTVADVAVRVGADLGPLQRNMKSGGRSMDRFGRQAAQTAKRVAAITAAVGLASAAIGVRMVRETNKSIDAQAKLARQLDGTINGLRAVQMAGKDAGVETGVLNSAMERLTSRLGDAMDGTGAAADALEKLGLESEALADMDIDERMATIADRMEEMGVSAAEAGDMLRDLGVRNGEVINLMRQGGDAIRGATTEVERFGLSLSEVDAAKVEAAQDAMSRVGLASEGLRQALSVELADTITAVSEQLQEEFVNAAGDAGEGIEGAVDVGVKAMANLLRSIGGVIRFVEGNDALQFGVLGAVIFGPKGRLLGAAIGASFAIIREQMARFGVGMNDNEEAARQLLGVQEDIATQQDLINRRAEILGEMDPDDSFIVAAQEEIDRLSEKQTVLQGAVEESSEAQEAYNDMLHGTTSRAAEAADALDRVADAMERSRDRDDEDDDSSTGPDIEAQEDRQEESLESNQHYLDRFLGQYSAFQTVMDQMRDAEVARDRQREQDMQTIRDEGAKGLDRLATMMESTHRGMFEVGKAAAISQTVIDTYAAAQASYKALAGIPVVGPGLGAAAAGAAIAGGLARVQSIGARSFNSGGGASGGGGGGADRGAAAASQQAQQGGGQTQQSVNLNLSLVGDSFSRSQVMGLGRDMVDEINNALDDGAQLRVSGT